MHPNVDEMSRYHAEGLHRVARVIEGNPEYDELMVHRLTVDDTDQLSVAGNIAHKRSVALASLHRKIGAARHTVFFPEFRGFCCDGNTKNNLREFRFFDELCMPIGVSVMRQNYALLPRVAIGRLSSDQTALVDIILRDLEAFYASAETITASLVHQHALYSRSFLSGVLSFSGRDAIRPSALVTANDHSPARVATSMVMKGLGVPRIYLQHAEVTPIFPPLDFEYSVLRNFRSLHTYEAIGPVDAGKTFILSREAAGFSADALSRSRSLPITVGIYPTSRILADSLQRLVAVLGSNPLVKKIVIKEHPGAAGAGLSSLQSFKNVEFSRSIPAEEHVAIVGNSSVVLELLHRGIPVYQNFSLDPVAPDYYGFVRSGITQEITTTDAAGDFWIPYELNEDWLNAYRLLDPTAAADPAADRVRFLSEMEQLKATPIVAASPSGARLKGRWKAKMKGAMKRKVVQIVNAHPRVPSMLAGGVLRLIRRTADIMMIGADRAGRFLLANTDMRIEGDVWRQPRLRAATGRDSAGTSDQDAFVLATVMRAEDPKRWFAENERLDVVPLSKVISALDKALGAQDRGFSQFLGTVTEATSEDSTVARWLLLRKCELETLPLSEAMLDRLLEFTLAFDGEASVRAKLEESLLSAVLRLGGLRHFDRLWNDGRTLSLESLSPVQRLKVSARLASIQAARGDEGSSRETSMVPGDRP